MDAQNGTMSPMDLNNLILPIGFVLLGGLLITLEAFIPSAGILGGLAGLSLLAGVVSAFLYEGMFVGTTFLAITLVGVAVLIQFLIKQWPKTAMGRAILVEPPPPEELLPDRSELHAMVGRVGQALSLMLPSGFIEIDGKRFHASAMSSVEEGTWVEVLSVRNGNNLFVREISEEQAIQAAKEKTLAENPLKAPIEDVLADPFADE